MMGLGVGPGVVSGASLLAALPQATAGFEVIDTGFSPLQKVILPIIGWDGRVFKPFGTCFVISTTGAALTAWHVVEDFVEQHGAASRRGDTGLYAIYETDEAPSGTDHLFGGLLPIVSVASDLNTDLCALKLMLPRIGSGHLHLPALQVHVGLPRVGQSCTAIGYPVMTLEGEVIRREETDSRKTVVEYNRRLATSRGSVEEIHPVKRDPYSLTFPCFLTDARFDSGMSGAPVIGDDGRVFGMVCTGWNLAHNGPTITETSYAALLAPFLGLGVAQKVGSKKIFDLWQAGAVAISGFEDVEVREPRHGSVIGYPDLDGR